MSTTQRDARREAIRRTLALAAGNAPDARALTAATLGTWRQIAAQLTPLIGARGVDALFGRALYLASKTFPWLASVDHRQDNAAVFAQLGALFESSRTVLAAEASHAVLAIFTGLLADLIGEPLTEQVLAPVWAPADPPNTQENMP